MRQVGFLANREQAERFADFLRAEGIRCSVDVEPGGHRIWVEDDDLVPRAKEELPTFLADPNNERYRNAVRVAKSRMAEEQLRRDQARANKVDLSERWQQRSSNNGLPITFALIALSVFVSFQTGFRLNAPLTSQLAISTDGTFRQILNGEAWRLVSPAFLHFSLMHIVFNLLWIYQFGMQIEPRRGSARFLSMVVFIAVTSNLAQFWFRGPLFGGMSGVVYGLFGYIWIRGKLDPQSGYWLPQQTIVMMLIWQVLCTLEIIPNVANWAHGVGLGAGIFLALIDSMIRMLARRR
ncbi:rhomboid family intramembrane serine protease [Schlesneria sp. T3-172]|uniref:rhomboid family intramembrane serine protease n=1 Tax=Schlesneria sphaerica TaxID=3373610 RepID=UPI0037CA2BEE